MYSFCISDYSDVTFIVEGKKLYAHRVILAARSDYFRALLYGGGFVESDQSEINVQVPYKAFKALLQYIYSGVLSLNKMKNTIDVLDILGLANQYGFLELEDAISSYLHKILSVENACSILDSARLFGLNSLIDVCHTFIDRNAVNVLKDEAFNSISEESLCGLLQRDSFFAQEVLIYKAVATWYKHHPSADIRKVLDLVRLPLMELNHLLNVVRPSGILSSDIILDAIAVQAAKDYLNYRGSLIPDENLATLNYGARAICGKDAEFLIDGDTKNYDMERGYASHIIDDDSECLMIEFGTVYILNHLKMLLWDRDIRSYSYYIEVSVNKEVWKRAIDHTEYHCRSWQFLYFDDLPVKYIRVVGTHNSVNRVFHCVALEAYYSKNCPVRVNGIVAPTKNIATLDRSAVVLEGVSRTRNALLNGDVKNYDWDSGYTCHQLGSGAITIQLGQPYYLSSCRILLWDCDERSYSFFIESSIDQKNWDVIVDKRNAQLKSWQHMTFTPRPIVYIRIVGTFNSVNEIFHIVHFETPSHDPKFLRQQSKETDMSPQQSCGTPNQAQVEGVNQEQQQPQGAYAIN